MKAVFLFEGSTPADPLTDTFRNYVNLAYMVAVSDEIPETALDRRHVLRACQESLANACLLAKRETEVDPSNAAKKFLHVYNIEAEIIDVFAVAPGAVTRTGLTIRGLFHEFVEHFRCFASLQTERQMRN